MNVLILGGVGFIGRNLVQYLIDQKAAAYIRVLDKGFPVTAFLSDAHKAAFENDIVDFKQANLSSPASIAKNFDFDKKWDLVVNLAAETKYGQTPEVYKEKILDVAKKCSAEAAKIGAKKWVEISTAQVYDTNKQKKAAKEDTKTKPWTNQATYKLEVEQHLASTGLDYVIYRAAIVYGPGDNGGLAPRIIIGAVYKHLKEKQKNLWTKDLSLNTVHVLDVCAAILHATKLPKGALYNLADKSNTNQGSINGFLEKIFGIKTGFYGKAFSAAGTKLGMKMIAEEANDTHLKPWSDLCKEKGIGNTPLSPYIDQELLYNNSLWVDGTAIEGTGFKYQHPQINEALFRQVMEYYANQGLFPIDT